MRRRTNTLEALILGFGLAAVVVLPGCPRPETETSPRAEQQNRAQNSADPAPDYTLLPGELDESYLGMPVEELKSRRPFVKASHGSKKLEEKLNDREKIVYGFDREENLQTVEMRLDFRERGHLFDIFRQLYGASKDRGRGVFDKYVWKTSGVKITYTRHRGRYGGRFFKIIIESNDSERFKFRDLAQSIANIKRDQQEIETEVTKYFSLLLQNIEQDRYDDFREQFIDFDEFSPAARKAYGNREELGKKIERCFKALKEFRGTSVGSIRWMDTSPGVYFREKGERFLILDIEADYEGKRGCLGQIRAVITKKKGTYEIDFIPY